MYSSPVRHCTSVLLHLLVRLACIRRAASVSSEPGSNSSIRRLVRALDSGRMFSRKHDGPGRETTAWSPRFTPHPSAAKFSRIRRQCSRRSLDESTRHYRRPELRVKRYAPESRNLFFRKSNPAPRARSRASQGIPSRIAIPCHRRRAPPNPSPGATDSQIAARSSERLAGTDDSVRPPRACTYSIGGPSTSLESFNPLPSSRFALQSEVFLTHFWRIACNNSQPRPDPPARRRLRPPHPRLRPVHLQTPRPTDRQLKHRVPGDRALRPNRHPFSTYVHRHREMRPLRLSLRTVRHQHVPVRPPLVSLLKLPLSPKDVIVRKVVRQGRSSSLDALIRRRRPGRNPFQIAPAPLTRRLDARA